MLTSEQIRCIELQCWQERFVETLVAILSTRQRQPREVLLAVVQRALTGAIDQRPDDWHELATQLTQSELLGETAADGKLSIIRQWLAADPLSESEHATLRQLCAIGHEGQSMTKGVGT